LFWRLLQQFREEIYGLAPFLFQGSLARSEALHGLIEGRVIIAGRFGWLGQACNPLGKRARSLAVQSFEPLPASRALFKVSNDRATLLAGQRAEGFQKQKVVRMKLHR
jgi:hypothetical protein